MTLNAAELVRGFLLHVLPDGFHRMRHYGLFAGAVRTPNIYRARQLLAATESLASERASAPRLIATRIRLRLRAETHVAAAKCSSRKPSKASNLRSRHRRAGLGSTPQDQHRASSFAASIAFASSRALESADLIPSEDPPRAPRRRQIRPLSVRQDGLRQSLPQNCASPPFIATRAIRRRKRWMG